MAWLWGTKIVSSWEFREGSCSSFSTETRNTKFGTQNPKKVMTIALIADEQYAEVRHPVLAQYCKETGSHLAFLSWPENGLLEEVLNEVDQLLTGTQVVFIGVSAAYSFQVAQRALREGVHVFVEWPAMPALPECEEMAQLAEEAGVEVGVSRTNRYHPMFERWQKEWHATSMTVHHDMLEANPTEFKLSLDDTVDLCCCFSGTSDVRKVEAQMLRGSMARPEVLLAGLRFQNGAYAQIQIRQQAPVAAHIAFAAGPGFHLEANLLENKGYLRKSDLDENARIGVAFESFEWPAFDLIEKETTAFLKALDRSIPAPVSLIDGYKTLRLVEVIRKNLR